MVETERWKVSGGQKLETLRTAVPKQLNIQQQILAIPVRFGATWLPFLNILSSHIGGSLKLSVIAQSPAGDSGGARVQDPLGLRELPTR
jgi:hypothetical protein